MWIDWKTLSELLAKEIRFIIKHQVKHYSSAMSYNDISYIITDALKKINVTDLLEDIDVGENTD